MIRQSSCDRESKGLVVSGGNEGLLIVWDAQSGAKRRELLRGEDAPGCIAFSSDGKMLAASLSNLDVPLWEVPSFRLVTRLQHSEGPIWSLAFCKQHNVLVVSMEQKTVLWDATSFEKRVELHSPKHTVARIAISPDGKTIATGGTSGVIKIWPTATLLEC